METPEFFDKIKAGEFTLNESEQIGRNRSELEQLGVFPKTMSEN